VLQVDASVGAMVLCSCVCPANSENPKCQDPKQVQIKKQYSFEMDSLRRVVLKVIEGSNITYRLITTMSNPPTGTAQSQFIGTSSSGFTGVLDAADSYFEQLGFTDCVFNSSGACDSSSAQRRRTMAFSEDSETSWEDNFSSRNNVLQAGPAALHLRRKSNFLEKTDGQLRDSSERDLRSLGTLDDSSVSGVQSPLICVKAGHGVMWSVSSLAGISHYPQYVPDSLFNTNPNFDYGSLLNLKKDVQAGRPVASFYQEFSTAGIYVFADGGDVTKQTVIGVVDPLVDCPSAFEKNPIQVLSTDNLQVFPSGSNPAVIAPDYALIAGMSCAIAAILLCSLACLYLRRMLGWGRLQVGQRSYREKQKKGKEDLHSMALKRQTSHSSASVSSNKMLDALDDQAAGYVDLEGFNVQALFDKLQDQTNLVTEQLTKQKDDVKEFYEKVERTLNGKLGDLQSDEISLQERRAQRRQEQIDAEILRRKQLGHDQLALAAAQRAARNAALNFLMQSRDSLNEFERGFRIFAKELLTVITGSENDSDTARLRQDESKLRTDLQAILDNLNQAPKFMLGSGAELVDSELIETGPIEGIIFPSRGARMKIGNEVKEVPVNCFVHPDSKRILPMEGNIWYDVLSGRFSVGSHLSLEAVRAGPLPYICNVVGDSSDCYPSTSAPYAHLVPPDNWWPLSADRTILDPYTGLRVPVLGVTLDFRTQKLALVGGSIVDPETRLLKPIRMYDYMEDPTTQITGLILGVTIDPKSLKVLPIMGRFVCLYSFHY
jgi:hypothetical protein